MDRKKEEQEPIAESFEAQVESIKQKGKDLKGDSRDFFQSIIQRLENNNQVLDDLRKEHTVARNQLKELKKQKESQKSFTELAKEIKQYNHRVNNLKKQIDNLKHNKQKSIARQDELQLLLKSFDVEGIHDDSNERIRQLKNKLDNANIKNQETQQLFKAYNQIAYLLERQKMHYTPQLQAKQAEIRQKERDLKELHLISRDSKHSMVTANNEYVRLRNKNAEAARKRQENLQAKTELLHSTMHRPLADGDESSMREVKPTPSLNSQPSILRNRANRQQRDKKDEKLRTVQGQYDEIREYFGTGEPEEIQKFFKDRQESAQSLNDQINELKEQISELQKKLAQTKSALDEAEYTSAKGVGGNRLLTEGRRIIEEKTKALEEARALENSTAKHRKDVLSAIQHLSDAMSLVQVTAEDVEAQSDPVSTLKWIHEKIQNVKQTLSDEDGDILSATNPLALQAYAARIDSQFDIQQVDSSKRIGKRQLDQFKRAPKDNKGEITLRVKDRNAIKALAQKEAAEAQARLKAKQKNQA